MRSFSDDVAELVYRGHTNRISWSPFLCPVVFTLFEQYMCPCMNIIPTSNRTKSGKIIKNVLAN